MRHFDRLTDDQRRAVRHALTGQTEEPVQVTTDPMPAEPDTGHVHQTAPDRHMSAEDVLAELLTIDPRLVDLAAERVARRQTETELAALRRLVTSTHKEGNEDGN